MRRPSENDLLAARIGELEAQVRDVRDAALVFYEIAYRDGFRDGVLFVPPSLSVAGWEAAQKYMAERRGDFIKAMTEPTTPETQN